MNKLFSLSVGCAIFTCATLVSAQQSSDIQNFLKSYGSRPPVAAEQPAGNSNQAASQNTLPGQTQQMQQQPQQTQQPPPPQTSPSLQPTVPAIPEQPQTSVTPYKSIHDRNVWERLKVPPKDESQEMQQQNPAPTTTDQNKNQPQKTTDHYNIFQ